MPDPIWLDSSTLIDALKGDPALNDQLSQYRRSGRQLLVTEWVEKETLYGNPLTQKPNKDVVKQVPDDKTRDQMKRGMEKIGVSIDRDASKTPKAKTENYKNSIKHWGNVGESDRIVLNEIKASAEARKIAAPEIITSEKPAQGIQKFKSACQSCQLSGGSPAGEQAFSVLQGPPLPEEARTDWRNDRGATNFFEDRVGSIRSFQRRAGRGRKGLRGQPSGPYANAVESPDRRLQARL